MHCQLFMIGAKQGQLTVLRICLLFSQRKVLAKRKKEHFILMSIRTLALCISIPNVSVFFIRNICFFCSLDICLPFTTSRQYVLSLHLITFIFHIFAWLGSLVLTWMETDFKEVKLFLFYGFICWFCNFDNSVNY